MNRFLLGLCISLLVTALPTRAADYDLVLPINGASFLWEIIVQTLGEVPLLFVLNGDLTTTAGATATIVANSLLVNETAAFLLYTATSGADQSVVEPLIFSSTFTNFNAVIDAQKPGAFSEYADAFPHQFLPTRPLFAPPPGKTEEELPVIGYALAKASIRFSGAPATWASVLLNRRVLVENAIRDAVTIKAEQPNIQITVTSDLSVLPASSTPALGPDGGRGGLLAVLEVMQGLNILAKRPYTDLEMASILSDLNTVNMTQLYNQIAPQPITVSILSSHVVRQLDPTCGPTCVGMIAMGSISGFIMLTTLLGVGLCVCCCYRRRTLERKREVHPQTEMLEMSYG